MAIKTLWLALLVCVLVAWADVCDGQNTDRAKVYVSNLTTELIEETDVVFQNGTRTEMPISAYDWHDGDMQIALINTPTPHFAWQIGSSKRAVNQLKYRILTATSPELLSEGKADVWDSGIIEDRRSTNITYNGQPLQPGKIYYWTVKIYYKKNKCTDYSPAKGFATPLKFGDSFSKLPLTTTRQNPVVVIREGEQIFMDFGDDAFGQIEVCFDNNTVNSPLKLQLGEKAVNNKVDTKPGGTIRYAEYSISPAQIQNGLCKPALYQDPRNTGKTSNESGVMPILMPDYIGEVYPFRYCGIEGYNGDFSEDNAERIVVNYPFDDNLASFSSSDTVLNKVWELCKHSMKATSFCGIFVDGDRERIPYEADALINQLSYYGVDNHYSIARLSAEHLVHNPTWPTEWILQMLIIAWNDYLYTGDDGFIRKYYDDLKNRTLFFLQNPGDNLLHTGNDITNTEHLQKVHFKGSNIRDIIDWPPTDRDNYQLKECNTVVNAFYYKALELMAKIAEAVGNDADREQFGSAALRTKESVNRLMTNSSGLYVDALGSEHVSLHSNMFPLAFGMVEDSNRDTVTNFVVSKGMACSVYGAQFLLDAIFDNRRDANGLKLLTDTSSRSFYNMIRSGSTITTEAWDIKYKNNQDWNHAWGAAAGNVIVRKVMGIEPLEPGFSVIKIAPQLGDLTDASITVPTPRGAVSLRMSKTDEEFTADVSIPPNTTAEITLPFGGGKHYVSSGDFFFGLSNPEPFVEDDAPPADIKTSTSERTNPNIKVWSFAKTIYIESAPGTPYTILDVNGRVLKTGTTNTDRKEIHLGGKMDGFVIVKIGGKTFKIRY